MIYLECDSDKALVSSLGISRKEIKHSFSKGNVCNRLLNSKNSKGLVDEDPSSTQPTYIRKLKPISNKDGIKFFCDERNENYLIMLCPRLEEWILMVAKEVSIDMSNYGLPSDACRLHSTINTNTKLDSFKRLIKDIEQKSSMLKTLEGLIKG
jgi:hypothetical protein